MEQTVEIARLILLILFPVVVLGSKQQAVLAWFLMGNLDASGSGFAAASDLGLINSVKGIVMPMLLAWRLREVADNVLKSWAGRLWVALIIYTIVAAFWSPFPLAAVKLVGNLIGILLMLVVFDRASQLRLLGTKFLANAIIFSLGLAVLQTFFLGGYWGYEGYEGSGVRFTSFISPQQYGCLLVAFLAMLLSVRMFKGVSMYALVLLVSLAILLSGSRTWLMGALIVWAFSWYFSMQKRYNLIFYHFLLAFFILAIAIWGNLFYEYLSVNFPRIADVINAFSSEDGLKSVGTYGNRQKIYAALWQHMASSSVIQIIFGHGTASGGYIFINNVQNARSIVNFVDPNRIVHNEWLRALYEWGIIGWLIFVGVFVVLGVGLIAAYVKSRNKVYIGVIAYLIPLCIALNTENILAGAGNAVTMGFGMVLGVMLQVTAPKQFTLRKSEVIP